MTSSSDDGSHWRPTRAGGRALVAGAAGFVGSHLVDRLIAEGWEVFGVDDLSTGRLANLAHLAREPRFRFVEADVVEPVDVVGPLDWVLHLASAASPVRYASRGIATLRANAEGTRRLLDLARRTGASFLLASTSEVYGDPAVHPQPETYTGNVDPTAARSVYTEGKRYAETLATTYHRELGVPVRIARIFNTYGPRLDPEDGRVVSTFVVRALRDEPLPVHGDGRQTRSFQYVDDLVEGLRRLMASDYAGPVNLGSADECSIVELAELVLELTGSRSAIEPQPLPEGDPRRRQPDLTRARQLLGWRASVPLRTGLARTIEDLRPRVAPDRSQPARGGAATPAGAAGSPAAGRSTAP